MKSWWPPIGPASRAMWAKAAEETGGRPARRPAEEAGIPARPGGRAEFRNRVKLFRA
jgi:hypothetical protein